MALWLAMGGDVVSYEFSENQAGQAGALQFSGSGRNCTFSNNSASSSVGGVTGGTTLVENCIFWNNTDQTGASESAQLSPSSNANVSNSIIRGLSLFAGNGNISLNPQFVDPLGPDGIAGTLDDDLRLMPNSPAIASGDNSLLPSDVLDIDRDGDTTETTPLDLDDTARIKGGTVDMGAYEAS
ncbi:MAG: hypothetical protein GXP29_01280 [Planctomycetes bacterium]|nr:hypothetical protein [Planctomycetota bacterium]